MKTINQRSEREWNTFDATMVAEGVEDATAEEVVEAWSILVSTGLAWQLQGWFGRQASFFIEHGILTQSGEIDWDIVDEKLAVC